MATLNKLPDGSPAPVYICVAESFMCEEMTSELTEWWFNGKQVETIEESAESYFYEAFDKEAFEVKSITRKPENRN